MADDRNVDVIDLKGKKAGSVVLPGSIFDVPTNIPLMHQVVVAQLAAARQGGANQDHAVLRTRDSAADEQQTLLGVHGLDRQVLNSTTVATHAAGHAHALEDA